MTPPTVELDTPPCPVLPVKLEQVTKRKTGSAKIRGAHIHVSLPQRWSNAFQTKVTTELVGKVQKQFEADWRLLHQDTSPLLTFTDPDIFEDWVRLVNLQTLNVPLKSVRIGHSKYTHLAQMNIKNRVMTVSRYCLNRVPESALRYLVIHELAHLKVANHSKAFWDEVKPHVPNLRYQRNLISAAHRIRIYEAERFQQPLAKPVITEKAVIKRPSALPQPARYLKQLLLDLF